ncbi:Putative pre-rRNA-processing protein RIX1 [Septoria linicola]|uniref:Pre-rRNA-processing protein RIX1 n=1 Tax=Septoria linicola TaxID=215465 RepID=A0A9Q9AKQ6_9PEZI|nr:putative pre-rRNA-processing protein RIX1 [Septoria linicola]USW51109.1 Putative pre-rRNA-processing protein RIX1 [Septoria linicola]
MAQSTASLRALTYRLTSTPTQHLPGIVGQIAGALWSCKDILSVSTDTKATGEAATAVHRYKTQLNTLLQDRTVEGRWAAVVLVKATIEAGGLEVLSKSNPWVKHLLGILKRPDPPTTRQLAVLTLTRIFMLTWDYSNIVREITTPALAAFIPTCISNIQNKRCSNAELETVLEAFASLVPKHPTTFRQNESKIRGILTTIISSSSTYVPGRQYSDSHRAAAARLLVLLHHCAPKQGGSDKWQETLKAGVEAAHMTCNHLFRAVHEDWPSVSGVTPSERTSRLLNGELEVEDEDSVGLKPWKGVYAGAERLIALLDLLGSHLAIATSTAISVRIGLVNDLLTRLFGVVAPYHGKQEFVKLNNQISRDERDALFMVLPRIHVAAMQLDRIRITRFSSCTISTHPVTIDHIVYVFQAEGKDDQIRIAAYDLLAATLQVSGPSMGKNEVGELTAILKSCCTDLLPSAKDATSTTENRANGQAGGIKQQLGMAGAAISQSHPASQRELAGAAQSLLRVALLRIEALPAQLRALVDRTAVLTRDHQLLQASVMNPPPKKSASGSAPASLLPFLAREFGETAEVDVLLRPRMPVIGRKTAEQMNELDIDGEDEEDEEDEAMIVEDEDTEAVPAAEGNVESPASSPLDSLGHNASLEPATSTTEQHLFASETAGKRRAHEDFAELEAKRAKTLAQDSIAAAAEAIAVSPPTIAAGASKQSAGPPASSAPTVASYHTATGGESEEDSDIGEIPEIHIGDSEDEE